MPNWCEGTLKVRGKRKDLINFLKNNLSRVTYDVIPENRTEKPIKIKDNEEIFIENNYEDSYLYFKNSKRMFPNGNIEIWLNDEEDEQIIYFNVRQAWDINAEYLQQLSQNNNVDIRIVGYEMGACFCHEVEIHKGNMVIDDTKQYHDDYKWLVDDPSLGG